MTSHYCGVWDSRPGALEAHKGGVFEANKFHRTISEPETSPGNTPIQGLSPHSSPATAPESPPISRQVSDEPLDEAHASPSARKAACTADNVASTAAMIYGGSTLTDVCDTLEFSGHSSAVVVGDDGAVNGILTENDILKAYADETPWEYDAGLWLQSGEARMPGFLLPVLTVEASLPLVDAAAKMAVQRLGDYACHHLLISGGGLGRHRILSALDICMALSNGDIKPDLINGQTTVADMMKLRGQVPEVKGSDCLKASFEALLASGQNCALVVEHEGGFVYGTITPRDALRAFVEHVPEGTPVSGWLRGLGTTLDCRRIDANASIMDAAQTMVTNSLHHLLVLSPGTVQVVGVISCLDIVCRIGARRLGESPSKLQVHAH